ncbi:MAG: transcriptional regulator [Gemmatimonadales bacterium]
MRFIETPVFAKALHRHLDDQQYRALQVSLGLRPEQGALIQGSGGARKLRWQATGRGKRGGLGSSTTGRRRRCPSTCFIYMLYLYAKSEQGDLSAAQIGQLARLIREEFK